MTFPGFFRDHRGIFKDLEGSFPCLKILGTFSRFFRDRRGICKDREGSFGSFPCLKILVTFSGFSLEIVGRFIRIVQDRLYRLVQDSFKAF